MSFRAILTLFCLLLPALGKAQDLQFSIPRYSLNQSERETVAAVLVLEAADQGRAGMEAVMSVINNRSKDQPALYQIMVLKPWQFSSLNSSIRNPARLARLIARAKTDPTWTLALSIIAASERGLLTDRTGGAIYFVERNGRPGWLSEVRLTVVIGKHRFFVSRTS